MCVADHRPRDWTPEQVAILTDLAGLVMTQIQLRAELATRGELERRLIDVEASLQALLERLPGVVYAVSPDSPNSVLFMVHGSIPALITPFRNGIVDERAFQQLVERQIAEGTHGLVPCGTTGESVTLSLKEHVRALARERELRRRDPA